MPYTIAVAVSEFNRLVTEEMENRAVAWIKEIGHRVGPQVHVAGSWDLPFVCDELLRRPDVDAVVALGSIVTGETEHDEVIGHTVAKTLLEIALDHRKPIGLGVTGPGQTFQQAKDRVDRAEASVEAVVQILDSLRGLDKQESPRVPTKGTRR
ncbi:MAG: 6,7-dimethyl-8-ribityllumazine synthase [Thermoplasmatota archaeon]